MNSHRTSGSPGSSHWDVEEEEVSSAHRSSFTHTSSASGGRRAAPSTHVDDGHLLHRSDADSAENFRVFIRVRPPVPRELNGYRTFVDVVQLSKDTPRTITLCDAVEMEDRDGSAAGTVVYSSQSFTFDHIHGPCATQEQVYERSARPAVLSVLQGYNATLMAYGQTGAGKTYTMEGFTNEEERGIIPRSVEEIFGAIRSTRGDGRAKFLVRASYMQIYNEVISDLLVPPGSAAAAAGGGSGRPMAVRHTPQHGVYVEGLSEWVVRTPSDVYTLIERGTAHRATSSTRMSELSSRSHAIFTCVVEALEEEEGAPVSYRFGKLNIVDLAGSEKVRQSGVTGQRLEETKKINRSLHELGNVISALATKSSGGRARHIPFRNSVLTSALRDSLGGNCKTTLIACISPALESYAESLSTLVFANRAKNIKTTAVVNEDMDQAMLLRKYERELRRLRELLSEQQQLNSALATGGGIAEHAVVSELEEGRARAEEGREAALAALEQSAKTCATLESRIRELESVLSEGGLAGSPHTSEEYAARLQELDREHLIMVEDKAQVDRYKQLLLKQRDVMLSLTMRLNERDETILQLQEEIDAYDAHVQLLEDQMADLLTAEADGRQGGGQARADAENASGQAPAAAETHMDGRQARSGLTEEESRGRLPHVSSPSPLAAEEVAELAAYVRRRADTATTAALRTRVAALQASRDALALQLAARESCATLYAKAFDVHSATEGREAVVAAIAAAEQAWVGRAQTLSDRLERETGERRRLAREVERLRFEVEQQLGAARVSPAQRAAASRLWQGLQAVEQELGELGGTQSFAEEGSNVARATAAKALAEAVAVKERGWRRVLEERQAAVDQLRRAGGGGPSAVSAPAAEALAAKEAEVASLQRELSIQKKDRRALRTILDQRMKAKVDRICALIESGGEDGALSAEAKSLQTLLNAAIKAMDS